MTEEGWPIGSVRAGLKIGAPILSTIVDHLSLARPHEGVGLLAVVSEGPFDRGVRYFPGTNIDRSATRYTMDPAEVIAALQAMDVNGWRFGAIVHSHVTTEPTPSETDLREAYYPDVFLLIIGFGTGRPEARLWSTIRPDQGRVAKAEEATLIVDTYPD